MIKLILDGKTAALPEDIDLTLEFENPFFTKNGSYSYDIELDLNNTLNLSIFGNINRLAVRKENVKMSCLLYKNDRLFFVGNATIMSISDTTVSVQLLGDSSSIHFFSKDIYIDEMELGEVKYLRPDEYSDIHFTLASGNVHHLFGDVDESDVVFFYASAYSRPLAMLGSEPDRLWPNGLFPDVGNGFSVHWPGYFSVQPYLIKVFERVISTMGYTLTRNDWNSTWLRNLYIVNHKEGDWNYDGDYMKETMVKALPHWSVSKFLDELEKLLAVVIIVDEHRKQVQVISLESFFQDMPTIEIPQNMILDAYEVKLDQADNSKSLSTGNIGFNHTYRDKFQQMSQEQIKAGTKVAYDSYNSIKTAFASLDDNTKKHQIFEDASSNRTYVAYTNNDTLELKECNIFGNLSRDGSDDTDVELNIIPADTKEYDVPLMFGSIQAAGQTVKISLPYLDVSPGTNETEENASRTMEDVILNGAPADKSQSEVMEIMINTGDIYQLTTYSGTPCLYPQSFIDHNIPISGRANLPQMSLSLHDVCEQSLGHRYRQIPVFDTSKPFRMTFFHPDKIDTRSILLIRNQKYVIRQFTVKMSHESDLNCYEAELYRLES